MKMLHNTEAQSFSVFFTGGTRSPAFSNSKHQHTLTLSCRSAVNILHCLNTRLALASSLTFTLTLDILNPGSHQETSFILSVTKGTTTHFVVPLHQSCEWKDLESSSTHLATPGVPCPSVWPECWGFPEMWYCKMIPKESEIRSHSMTFHE